MRIVLKSTQTTSDIFTLSADGKHIVGLDVHTTGTWTLSCRLPGGTSWLPVTGVSLDGVGFATFDGFMGLEYRLTGGAVGAVGFASASYLG